MTNSFALPRRLIIFALILPIAALVGYNLASPDFGSFALIGLLATVLCIPAILRWHHALLFLSWNAALQVFFLPGQPMLWMLMSVVGLTVSVLSGLLHKRESQTFVPSVVWPLIVLTLVVLITAKLTGGIGLRVFGGSTYGGKRYIYFFVAVIGYFALTAQRIPSSKVNQYVGMFFLSSITAALGHLVYYLGPSFWILYAVLPVGYAGYQAMADFTGSEMVRFAGFTTAGMGIAQFMFCRFGIRGVLEIDKPWRLLIFFGTLILTFLGGFRSGLLTLSILFALQFYFEGLHRTRIAVAVGLAILMLGVLAIPLATKMPLSVQRALAVLPIEVDPIAKRDAFASSEWRVKMWDLLIPQIPNYLLLGKGSTVDPTDMYLVAEAQKRGHAQDFESSMVAGDYHSAPLSLIIQFGIWGVIAFAWFCIAALKFLYSAYRDGPPELKRYNTFLLSSFITNLICFCSILGSFADHLSIFTGIIGFSVSLNGSRRVKAGSSMGLATGMNSNEVVRGGVFQK